MTPTCLYEALHQVEASHRPPSWISRRLISICLSRIFIKKVFTDSHNHSNSCLVGRLWRDFWFEPFPSQYPLDERVDFDNDGKVLYDGKLTLNSEQEIVNIGVRFHKAQRSTEAQVGNNIDSQVLDTEGYIKYHCASRLGNPLVLDHWNPAADSFVDDFFNSLNILPSILFNEGWSTVVHNNRILKKEWRNDTYPGWHLMAEFVVSSSMTLRYDVGNMRIDLDGVKPRSSSVVRSGCQNASHYLRIICEQVVWSNPCNWPWSY